MLPLLKLGIRPFHLSKLGLWLFSTLACHLNCGTSSENIYIFLLFTVSYVLFDKREQNFIANLKLRCPRPSALLLVQMSFWNKSQNILKSFLSSFQKSSSSFPLSFKSLVKIAVIFILLLLSYLFIFLTSWCRSWHASYLQQTVLTDRANFSQAAMAF